MGRRQAMAVLHPVHGYKIKPQENLKTIKRNQRERSRVETVNKGFESLRLQIPRAAAMGKLSKVGILGEAVDYIQYLHTLLNATTNTNLHQQSFHLQDVEEGYYSDIQMSPSSPPIWMPAHNEAQFSPQSSPDKTIYSHQTEYRMASQYSPDQQYRESCQYSPPQGHSSSPPHHSFNSPMAFENWSKTETKEDIIDSIVEWQQHN